MHPEIMRELTAQRGREMQERARQAKLARIAIRGRRRGRSRPAEADGFVLPAIPDYVDGSFRTERAAEREASTAGATRHAA